MSSNKETKARISNKNKESNHDHEAKDKSSDLTGDEILENMLNTPPKTHKEMKEKKKK